QPGRQRLFVSVKRFSLVKSGLLRLLRSGEANSQRLLIGAKGLNLLEDGLFLFFRGGQSGSQRLFVCCGQVFLDTPIRW
ncbi:hypothetical protein K28_21790, partial [Klebsiella pneumoniae]